MGFGHACSGYTLTVPDHFRHSCKGFDGVPVNKKNTPEYDAPTFVTRVYLQLTSWRDMF